MGGSCFNRSTDNREDDTVDAGDKINPFINGEAIEVKFEKKSEIGSTSDALLEACTCTYTNDDLLVANTRNDTDKTNTNAAGEDDTREHADADDTVNSDDCISIDEATLQLAAG